GRGEPTTVVNGGGEVIRGQGSASSPRHADRRGDDEVVEYLQGDWPTIEGDGECAVDAEPTGEPPPRAGPQSPTSSSSTPSLSAARASAFAALAISSSVMRGSGPEIDTA